MIKNITLSADEHIIYLAREKARKNKRTLNAIFREWLINYTNEKEVAGRYLDVMKSLSYVKPGKHFTRDELNER